MTNNNIIRFSYNQTNSNLLFLLHQKGVNCKLKPRNPFQKLKNLALMNICNFDHEWHLSSPHNINRFLF